MPSPLPSSLADPLADRAATAAGADERPSFEKAIAELETIVERMEDGTLSLEDSLAAYRRGAALVKACEGALEHAREQVRVLDGDLLKPLSPQPESLAAR